MKIFDMDGPVYKVGNEIADALILTLLWFICSIPILTIGASTSALFYIYGKKARGEDIYVLKDFWKSFRQNFLQSIPITIVLGIMWLSVYAYKFLIEGAQGAPSTLISGLALFFTLEVTIISIYVLAVLSRFHMKVFNMFLTSFVLAHRHLLKTVLIVVGVTLLQYASIAIPFLLFLMPVLVAGIASVPIQKIFTQHIEASEAAQQQPIVEEEDEEEEDEEEEDEEEDDASEEISETEDGDQKQEDFLKYI